MKKKILKSLFALLVTGTMLFATACGAAQDPSEAPSSESAEVTQETSESQEETPVQEEAEDVEVQDVKIAMMIWDNGPQQTATQNYCKALEEGIEGLSFVYGQLDSGDEDANVAACQAMIAQGCQGIILYNQTLGLPTIADMCRDAGVYVATYLSDPDPDMKAALEENPFYVGGVMDGPLDTGVLGKYAAELSIANGYKHIGSVSFPLDVLPPMKSMVDAFYGTIEEYNETAAEEDQIELYENEEVFFTQVDASYFANHPEIDAVFGAGGGVLSVYPTIVSAGLTDKVKLVSTGMLYDDDTIAAIENGNIVLATTSSVEQLIYPVAMIHNAVHGLSYADQPAVSETAGCGIMYIQTSDDIQVMKDHSYLYASDYSELDRLMITPQEAKEYMLAFNPDATYAELTAVLETLNMDTLAAK